MTLTPHILLTIGATFSFVYAAIIICGWARTRYCRRVIRLNSGIKSLPLLYPDGRMKDSGAKLAVSLDANVFTDADGRKIDVSQYEAYIAAPGEWNDYPGVEAGDLLLMDKETRALRYAFTVPDISDYR